MLYTLLRSILLASSLAVVNTLMASAAAFADTKSASSIIGGTVASIINITATNPNTTIDLSPGQSNTMVKVADLKFGTNNSAGLKVTAIGSSVLILGDPDPSTPSGFLIAINDETAHLGNVPSTYLGVTKLLFSTDKATSISSPYSLYIRYNTPLIVSPGIYEATIKLTVTDN